MLYQLAGIAVTIFGILVAIFGDKMVGARAGTITKAVSMPPTSAKLVKWVVVVLLVWFGVALFIEGGPL
jgi:hypothetical protein